MVCKNCGADLKPGVKYCLECGNYIDEEVPEETGGEVGKIGDTPTYTFKESTSSGKKKKKKKMSTTDLLIYGALGLVIVVSLVIIILSVINSNKPKEPVNPEPVVKEDTTLAIDVYKITVPGEYLFDVQGDILYVSDDVNFTFSYRNTTDDYDLYADDLSVVTKELENNKYEVFFAEKKYVSNTEFLCYKLKANGSIKYLYITKASSYYTSLGVIEVIDDGDWEAALPVIAKLNKDIVFTANPPKKDKDKDKEKDEDELSEESVTEITESVITTGEGPQNPGDPGGGLPPLGGDILSGLSGSLREIFNS